jgi:zinc protease
MKNIIILFAILFGTVSVKGQNEPYELTIEGVKVIVHPVKNQLVEVLTVFKGGVQNYPINKQGIEYLALNALTECGTKNDDKNSFKDKLDKVSGQIYGNFDMDYSVLGMNCISSDLNTVWPLYLDALTAPAFNEKEFQRIKQDAINMIKSQESDPDYTINKYAKKVAFAGKDYAKDPYGSEDVVSKLTVAETKTYYQQLLNRNKLLIVIVGDVQSQDIESKLKTLLSKIPAGKAFSLKKEKYEPASNTFNSTKKEFATNYILGTTSGPLPGTKDYLAYRVAMNIFSDRHFLEVRSKNGLSYAPNAYFGGSSTSVTNVAVSTTDPNKYISVFNSLVDKVKKEGFTNSEVKNEVNTYSTRIFYRQETNGAQASSYAVNEVLFGDWRRSITMKSELAALTTAQVSEAFRKYFGKISWVYMGNPAQVNPGLYTGSKSLPPSKVAPTQKKN